MNQVRPWSGKPPHTRRPCVTIGLSQQVYGCSEQSGRGCRGVARPDLSHRAAGPLWRLDAPSRPALPTDGPLVTRGHDGRWRVIGALREDWTVENHAGWRFWLFRQGDGVDPATGGLSWFLHGFF